MPHSMYWLDVDADRHGLEIAVNGIPAERLLKTHGIRMPINEYCIMGANRIEVRRGLWASNKPDDEPGEVTVRLVHARFNQTVKAGEDVVFEQKAEFQTANPRSVLLSAQFVSETGGNPLGQGFDPIGPAEREKILDELERVTAMWRFGDGDGLAQWMNGYIADYAAAYPLERPETVAGRVRKMAGAFKSETPEFDRMQTLLDPVPGTSLVDCLGPNGAAVRVRRAAGAHYDMWAVVGIRGGKVQLVR